MKKITRKNLEKFLEKNATDAQVLDIGAGHVDSNHSYTKFFPNRYTIDIDEQRMPDVVGDVHKLPFYDNSYNVVLCTEVLEHCHTPQLAIDEMYRVLKPGGKLILTTRFVYPLHDVPHDYFRFTKYGLEYLLKNWNDVEIVAETKTFSAVGALLQRVCFQTKLKTNKLSKAILFALAFMFDNLNWLLKDEFGNIQKSKNEQDIMATGYYVLASKR